MKPIIFNTEMVKAILSGGKVSTRRPVKCQKRRANHFDIITNKDGSLFDIFDVDGNDEVLGSHKMPCEKDDILYVRETWGVFEDCHIDTEEQRYFYRANMDGDSEEIRQDYIRIGYKYQFKPSIHMPKKAARLFLKVTNVRVERVQDITEDEAAAEGGDIMDIKKPAREWFKNLWNNLYKNWDSNPWVWVIDFEVVKL